MKKNKSKGAVTDEEEEAPQTDAQSAAAQSNICPLCGRELAEPMNRHHLTPISRGGRGTTTVIMHKICHSKVHAVLTEKELANQYNNIEALQEQEEIAKFIKWVSKKPPEFYDGSVKMKR